MNNLEMISNLLEENGTTESFEKLQPIFKIGCGLDSESTTISHTNTVKVGKTEYDTTLVDHCYCYCWQYAFTKDKGYIVRTVNEIINIIGCIITAVTEYNNTHNTNALFIIWCANLTHEWSFLKKYIADYFNITKCFAKTEREVLYIQLNNCVELRECIGLFGHSLADIAKNWCSLDNQKLVGDLDYNLVRTWSTPLTDTEQQYCINDVTVLAEMHQKVIAAYTQPNGVCRLPYTESGFVRMTLKESIRNDEELTSERENYNFVHNLKKPIETNIKYLKRKHAKMILNEYQWYICREYSFAGGLSGTNIDNAGIILDDVIMADEESDYPAQMNQRKYPTGSIKEHHGNLNQIRKELQQQHKPYFAVLKIKEIKSKSRVATLSEHKIINHGKYGMQAMIDIHGLPHNMIVLNGKIYKANNIVVCWNDIDIAAYTKIYDIKCGVIQLWSFDKYAKLPKWFTQPIIDGYAKKTMLKRSGIKKGQQYNDAKRVPNSMYGVCAQKVTDVYGSLDDDLMFKTSKEKTFKRLKYEHWLNPYIAFWTTSYARYILMYFISMCPNAIVQFDTDSLYVRKKYAKELIDKLHKWNDNLRKTNALIFKDQENPELLLNLGLWDFDEPYDKFLGMGAKKYIKKHGDEIEAVIAGLPKDAIPKEIITRGIREPFNYYNPLIKYIKSLDNTIIIDHMFANKLSSVYNDKLDINYDIITDYQGNTSVQQSSTYHALIPINFTLQMKVDFINYIINKKELK